MFSSTRVVLTSLFILLALSSALAQGGTGQLSGSVADTNGAVVPGANVKLTSLVTHRNARLRPTTPAISCLRFFLPAPTSWRLQRAAFAASW